VSPCANSIRIKYKLSIAILLPCEMVSSSPNVDTARQHFQRTLNALVGSGGQGYKEDAEVGNPLEGMPGEAVIPDLITLVAQKHLGSDEALRIAELARDIALKAISMPTLPDIQRWARVVCCLLRCSLEAVDP
jgi:hypothetical protein